MERTVFIDSFHIFFLIFAICTSSVIVLRRRFSSFSHQTCCSISDFDFGTSLFTARYTRIFNSFAGRLIGMPFFVICILSRWIVTSPT